MNGKKYIYASVDKAGTWDFADTWDDCKRLSEGRTGFKCKKFTDKNAALLWLRDNGANISGDDIPAGESILPSGAYAFTDGSYNSETKRYGYGGFLNIDGRRYPLCGCGNDADLASMRNIAGEFAGCMAAVKKAEELGIGKLTICYDYAGIEAFASGTWHSSKPGVMAYAAFMQSEDRMVELEFMKVTAHTGIPGNEMADAMAKAGAGISLTKHQKELYEAGMNAGSRNGMDISGITGMNGEDEREFV